MSKDLTIIDDELNLPAHLQGTGSGADDLTGGLAGGYPIISIKGKRFAISDGGSREVVMRPDDPDEPASSLQVVIVKSNPHLSKVYYAHGYVEGSDEKPTCYSNNGTKPALDAADPQSPTCAVCPHNQWGSRISDSGAKGKACSDSRRIAVCPVGELDRPMLLRVPAATLRELANYAGNLKRRNAPYQAVVTKLSFDNNVAHPKLNFKAIRWLDAKEWAKVQELMSDPTLDTIVGTTEAASEQVTPPAPKVEATPKAEAKPAAKKESKPKAEAEDSETAKKMASISNDLDSVLAELDD